MSTRKMILGLLILSFVGFAIGYLMTNSYDFGFCYSDFSTNTFDVSCHDSYENIGNPLFYGMSALSIIFLILTFLPETFPAWKKFAKWFIPLATLLFIFYPDPGSGDYLSPYPEQVFKWVSIVYVAVSLAIISWNLTKQKLNKVK